MMCQVVAKNSFISFDFQPQIGFSSSRSRSADSAREQNFSNVRQKFEMQSAQRLNAVLEMGFSSAESGAAHPNELQDLQAKLAKALATAPAENIQKKSTLKHRRTISCTSVSTMAPDDASDFGANSPGSLLRHVMSSGSVSTMVSDFNDALSEDGSSKESESCGEVVVRMPDTKSEAIAPASGGSPTNRKLFECSHSLVPRNQNWADMQDDSRDEPPTTMMVRNIPSRYSQQDFMMDLSELGFAGTFDFLYIPMDKKTHANVGYAFVNFIDGHWANKCMQSFQNYRFKRSQHGSKKVATVSVAHLQGLAKNLEHYANSAVNACKQAHRKPVVMPTISSVMHC